MKSTFVGANIKPGTFILFPGTGKKQLKCTNQQKIEFLNESFLVTIKSVSESRARFAVESHGGFDGGLCIFFIKKFHNERFLRMEPSFLLIL